MDAAIAECRARTLAHMALPGNERFTMEFVTGKSWSAYNWYQGGNQSLIHIDWMIGSDKTDIDGIHADGRRVPVFRKGEWA